MNVKEQHVVTGMSRDSAVSQHNPNLVYDAKNIRITTKDGNNSLLSVTNERGTKIVELSEDSDQIVGIPIGSASLGQYLVLFTHIKNAGLGVIRDHIYRCVINSDGTPTKVETIFSGNANFSEEFPIETLPIYETDSIQKVYWVDGRNQPRMINICRETPETNADKLNFSRTVNLAHNPISITKNEGGGLFPTGTIQYLFSYYDINGQETRLIDVSPMYYLSPRERGAKASETVQISFTIKLSGLDTSFDFIRLYSIIRTTENGAPQARLVGDYPCASTVTITDDGIIGSTIDASSLYFIGGEECIAGTLTQKDNTLFLGDITLTRPNLYNLPIKINNVWTTLGAIEGTNNLGTVNQNTLHYYDENQANPSKSSNYYDYSIDNNRSSYYIKRFKQGEHYRLGFIAQYKNGQWSDPLWIADRKNEVKPIVSTSTYTTGRFSATIDSAVVNALLSKEYKRIAPVVVYPQPHERNAIAQGVICPTVAFKTDREDNAPYMQSSWFFRYSSYATSGSYLTGNNHPAGEIQCMDAWASGDERNFFVDGQFHTFHSPDVECTDTPDNLDLNNLLLKRIGTINAGHNRVIEHFITVENAGIDTYYSQVIHMQKNIANTITTDYFTHNFPLYTDQIVDNAGANQDNADKVVPLESMKDYVVGWIVYPWHRSGSLNNQKPLSTKQKQNGYNTRTAMLKRNITATSWFGMTTYLSSESQTAYNIDKPVLYNADQLAAVKVDYTRSNVKYSANYYGNIDKILTAPKDGKYCIYHGWYALKSALSTKSPSERSEEAIRVGYNGTSTTVWSNSITIDDDHKATIQEMYSNDPVSMKYKSSPHLVISSINTINGIGSYNDPNFILAELQRTSDPFKATNSSDINKYELQWIRCGDSVPLTSGQSATIQYMQGDCYVQRYDCLKTYPFTNEDVNSVIEIMSFIVESYVNLDFRTDVNRGGSNNYAINPTNFNLFNHSAYEQSGNFFIYRSINPLVASDNKFPNVVTWSLPKKFGEDVDTWASIDLTNTVDLDGALGKLTKVINHNNDVYAFQSIGFAQLLFNSRVQIPTSDNVPIEITNGMKMDGKKYISTKVGCTNKWSIIETPMGLYFIDDILRTTYLFNGQLQDISSAKGMKSWMNESCGQLVWNSDTFDNCRAFYDKVGKDIYWVYKDVSLVYSEVLGQYMSFMDYGSIPLIENAGNSTFAVTTLNLNPESFDVPIKNSLGVNGSIHLTAKSIPISLNLDVNVTEYEGQEIIPPVEVSWAARGIMRVSITINIANTDPRNQEYTKYTIGEIITALEESIANNYFEFGLVNLNRTDTIYTSDQEWIDYSVTNNFSPMRTQSPFWELGTGEYNMFFGEYKPYWLTFISNSNPTENKIFSTLEWRDIVKQGTTDKPLDTFDHARVWTEHQDTQSVAFTNSVTSLVNKQPIQYNAAGSNLRKKFNVWRFQIPRDKLSWNRRARISNPWCYIKLSRDNINTERHEFTDLVVSYLV